MSPKKIIRDGDHTNEVLSVLGKEIGSAESLNSIIERAASILEQSVDPIGGEPEQPSDGLLYGLIQSGKTSIITVTAAMAADNGFNCILILTSDNNPLYDQTQERISKALRGLKVLGKNDWMNPEVFGRQVRTIPFAIVCSKNGSMLESLLEAFKTAGAKGLSVLIIDDEADQASLNTYASKGTDQISRINEAVTNFRDFFKVNTYLQVTATPQALFLQKPDHRYRPSFTVLSEPGHGYVGGEVFFDDEAPLLRYVSIDEVDQLCGTHQPKPSGTVPNGLRKALFTFLIGATAKVMENAGEYAFLCHVSVRKGDHDHIRDLIDRFKEDTLHYLQDEGSEQHRKTLQELQEAYKDVAETHEGLPEFDALVKKIKFFLNGANIKVVNASSNQEIRLDGVYNIFVGGNKLGRGVTIKNLIVSYYGRNPKRPNSDTVLQHARMYGYRRDTLDVTRLFLPEKLADHFRLIHQMETGLRDLIENYPNDQFQGLYITSPLQATRRNVTDPTSIGAYVGGRSYNPAYPLRSLKVKPNTDWLDEQLASFDETTDGQNVSVDTLMSLLEQCPADPEHGIEMWNLDTIRAALEQIKSLHGDRAYLVVRRGRALLESRRETQGIISRNEGDLAPTDAPTLFMYRQDEAPDGGVEVWWPQLRFPEGRYFLAFSFEG